MKLIKAHAKNYRNIIDSNVVDIGQATCLVGKNEAGKTAFLRALEGLRSTDRNFREFNKIEHYPRRLLSEYESNHINDEATVISTTWEISDEEMEEVERIFGAGSISSNLVEMQKKYGDSPVTWSINFDNTIIINNILSSLPLSIEERTPLSIAKDTQKLKNILDNMEEKTNNQSKILSFIEGFRDNSAHLHIIDMLSKTTPKFMYFSHYDRMSGEISINKIHAEKRDSKPLNSGDQVFLDFLEYAGSNIEELVAATKFEELNAKCEAAAHRITNQIFEYWSQNDNLKIKVVFSEGKPGDPSPFDHGAVARARVENALHGVTVPFSERSAGFVWFFSFLAKFAQIKKKNGNVILLLDEPGLTLHGTAQKDLLKYFYEEIAPNHQLIWTTHSPFMVPADDLASVRTVEDVVQIDKRGRKVSIGTKIRSDVLTTDPQTNFPIFGAMGFELTQSLIIGPNTLLVEGASDILYLKSASSILKKLGRPHLSENWAICPSGGIDKILPFVRLFYGNNLNIVVLTDFERGQRRKLDDLYKSELLKHERIILATQIADKEEADIEDFFDSEIFVDLVNLTYNLKGKNTASSKKIEESDKNTQRIVKKMEAYFRTLPAEIAEFSHYDPALYLLQHPEILSANTESAKRTLDRFEKTFEQIRKFEGTAKN